VAILAVVTRRRDPLSAPTPSAAVNSTAETTGVPP
jgi:hypothetical protein